MVSLIGVLVCILAIQDVEDGEAGLEKKATCRAKHARSSSSGRCGLPIPAAKSFARISGRHAGLGERVNFPATTDHLALGSQPFDCIRGRWQRQDCLTPWLTRLSEGQDVNGIGTSVGQRRGTQRSAKISTTSPAPSKWGTTGPHEPRSGDVAGLIWCKKAVHGCPAGPHTIALVCS